VKRGPLDQAALFCLFAAGFVLVYAGVYFAVTGHLPQ